MTILFLDDDENRTNQVIKRFANVEELITVTTAKEAIEKLQTKDSWDYVFLDHDLGGKVFVDSNREDCGMEVVRWCLKNMPKINQIIVHSWNEPAGKRMTEDLESVGYNTVYSPFGMW